MLIPFDTLIKKYKLYIKGILHVGAHECEELNDYEKVVPRNKIIWVEAMPDKVRFCKNKYPNIQIENAIVSDKCEQVVFYISNNGQSSSILPLGTHKIHHPHVHYTHSFIANTCTLNQLLRKYNPFDFNFVNLDIQGAELSALKGMHWYLHHIDYIYTEVNAEQVYEGAPLIEEIDLFLKQYGFFRVEVAWTQWRWGDAFYMKEYLFAPFAFV